MDSRHRKVDGVAILGICADSEQGRVRGLGLPHILVGQPDDPPSSVMLSLLFLLHGVGWVVVLSLDMVTLLVPYARVQYSFILSSWRS